MSRARKETMLKFVAHTIPNYIMSCFQLPDNICDCMRASISNHWWGFEESKKKMHWKSWDWLTTPKFMGGMGFRDMKLFNQTLLARQCWRLLIEPDFFCTRVLKGRYFHGGSFLDSSTTRTCSFTWRSLVFGKDLLQQGILWKIGEGDKVRITRDRRVSEALCYPIQPIVHIPDDTKVCALID
jgi:hypothetical protein